MCLVVRGDNHIMDHCHPWDGLLAIMTVVKEAKTLFPKVTSSFHGRQEIISQNISQNYPIKWIFEC